jgi:hypothetical protein
MILPILGKVSANRQQINGPVDGDMGTESSHMKRVSNNGTPPPKRGTPLNLWLRSIGK